MFGKKNDKKQTLPNIKIDKIPDDFYAGTNPIVKFKAVEKQVDTTPKSSVVLSSTEKKKFENQTVVGSGKKLHPINLFANGKFLIVASLVLLLFGGLIMGGYYYWQYKKINSSNAAPSLPAPTINNNAVPVEQNPVASSTGEVANPPVDQLPPVETNSEPKIDFPSALLSESIDTDKDGISDVAEELFKTDPAVADTDKDKYSDGHEVYYLYNPAGLEPMKLIDSGLVKIYSNPTFSYQLYYPVSWVVGSVDSSNKDVLFSTLNGENIEVRVISKDPNQSFNDWFGKNAPNEKFSDYSPFESVFKETGIGRSDGLVYLFPKDNFVVAILYHTTDSNVVSYKIVNTMVGRSFQFGQANVLPERTVEDNLLNPVTSTNSVTTSSVVVSSSIQ